MIHDGLSSEGETEIMQLTRSAWAGMQRWGAALWSGDTTSTFDSLKVSLPAGLNTQMSGIAWWTTDVSEEGKISLTHSKVPLSWTLRFRVVAGGQIGGYGGGNPSDPVFRELIVRWFQYGMTCPLFRQHGSRPTEIWLLGNVSEAAVTKVIRLREQFRPYIRTQMERLSRTGQPLNRPLFWDFPEVQPTASSRPLASLASVLGH